MQDSSPPAFLLRYQEPAVCSDEPSMAVATTTKTSAREGADQDVGGDWRCAGTLTLTETREQRDQDASRHMVFGTQTRTDSFESPDNDVSDPGWAVIPRA